MISADTSSLIEYLKGGNGPDIEMIDAALSNNNLIVSPVVVSELLSDPKLSNDTIKKITLLPQFEVDEGYWRKVGFIWAKLIAKKLKVRLADTLIAQSCIEHDIPLITRDKDFRHFKKHCGLKLLEF
ncbi:MAG: PIN domain-containing protein [Alphaproteobacteria bacterium]|nr:PIN domain-containing protein [Alphaproteobacteria bacterium]